MTKAPKLQKLQGRSRFWNLFRAVRQSPSGSATIYATGAIRRLAKYASMTEYSITPLGKPEPKAMHCGPKRVITTVRDTLSFNGIRNL
jgi:hypothetical protein